jgi:hypothetical protein
MRLFKLNPMKLEYGEPIHQMVARAFMSKSIRVTGDIFYDVEFHFVGPHGISYRGVEPAYRSELAKSVAEVCENIQRDFNERIAAMDKAKAYARETLAVPPLFTAVGNAAA